MINLINALFFELTVADTERFIDDQNLRFDADIDGEPQSRLHAARIGTGRLIDVISEICEFDDLRFQFTDFLVGKPHQLPSEIDIFTPRKLRIKARGQFQQRADTSVNRNLAGCRICYACNHLENGGLAGAVFAEQRDRFPLLDGKRKVVDRDFFFVLRFLAE